MAADLSDGLDLWRALESLVGRSPDIAKLRLAGLLSGIWAATRPRPDLPTPVIRQMVCGIVRERWTTIAASLDLALPTSDEQCAHDGCVATCQAICHACRYVRCVGDLVAELISQLLLASSPEGRLGRPAQAIVRLAPRDLADRAGAACSARPGRPSASPVHSVGSVSSAAAVPF